MKNINKVVATLVLVGIFGAGNAFAKTGIIYTLTGAGEGARQEKSQPCSQDESKDWGIIYTLTGIIYTLTGSAVEDDKQENVNCGIIYT